MHQLLIQNKYRLFKKEWWEQLSKENLESTLPHFFEKLTPNQFLSSTFITSAYMYTTPFNILPSQLDPTLVLADLHLIWPYHTISTSTIGHRQSFYQRVIDLLLPSICGMESAIIFSYVERRQIHLHYTLHKSTYTNPRYLNT